MTLLVEIDNTLIYLVSRPLTPPGDVLTAVLPSIDLSTYLAAVFSTSLAETVKNLPRTTFLVPNNKAWAKMGLVATYLLMGTSKKELESVVLHHILDSIQYLSALRNGTERTFRTFEGTDIGISRHRHDDGEVEVVVTGSGGWDGLHAKLDPSNKANTLTETGVAHEIDTLMIPRSVEINLGKLVKAAGGGTMASLVTRAGFEWVLNGTAPPEDSEYSKLGDGVGWTLLVPRDEAWRDVNLTALWDDGHAIRELVTQHLIPTFPPSSGGDKDGKGGKKPRKPSHLVMDADENTMPLDMNGANHVTARSSFSSYGEISFIDKGDHFVVGITGARGTHAEEDWATIMSWGRSTVSAGPTGEYGARGGVIKIDRVLKPYTPKWWVRFGPPIAGGVVGLGILGAVGYTVRWLYKRRESEPTYEPVGRDEEEDG
jgi:solute carrier family 25 (mitochondrial carnitine/acylcarnitine transporter), member 20/29